jgi:hypothetical protein
MITWSSSSPPRCDIFIHFSIEVSQSCRWKDDEIVHRHTNAEAVTDRVIVMARSQTEDFCTAWEAQRIEKIGAAKNLGGNLCICRTVVVVENVIRANQNIHFGARETTVGDTPVKGS